MGLGRGGDGRSVGGIRMEWGGGRVVGLVRGGEQRIIIMGGEGGKVGKGGGSNG